jgi:hypothetical protein
MVAWFEDARLEQHLECRRREKKPGCIFSVRWKALAGGNPGSFYLRDRPTIEPAVRTPVMLVFSSVCSECVFVVMVIRVAVAIRLVSPSSFEYDLSTAAHGLRGS